MFIGGALGTAEHMYCHFNYRQYKENIKKYLIYILFTLFSKITKVRADNLNAVHELYTTLKSTTPFTHAEG